MELRAYWGIIRKRLWLTLALVAVVGVGHFFTAPRMPSTYSATMRFVVGLRPEVRSGNYYTYDRYYTWLTAEYLLDDLAEVVKSRAFAQDVAAQAGIAVAPGVIQGSTAAGKLHRILTITLGWGDRDELVRLGEAIVQVLSSRNAVYLAQLGTENAIVSLIDPPNITRNGPSLRQRLDLPLRLLLALLAGIFLAFLLDYIDDTIRHRADAEALGLPILAEVPVPRRHWLHFWRRHSLP